jgi:hypothetical protein
MITARSTYAASFATIFAVSAFALTGCGATADDLANTTAPAAGAASAAAEPREVLLKAVPGAETAAYTFKVKGGTNPMTGIVDTPHQALEMTYVESDKDAGFTMKMDARKVDGKVWVKLAFTPADLPGLPPLPKKWVLLEKAKLDDKSMWDESDESDPGYTQTLVTNAAGLKLVSAGHYAGTTDLTKATDTDILEAATLKALGEKAKTVPFEAVVDGAGHLASATLKIPAAGKTKAQTYSVNYSGFGRTATPAAPAAGEQQKATSSLYELLNS